MYLFGKMDSGFDRQIKTDGRRSFILTTHWCQWEIK